MGFRHFAAVAAIVAAHPAVAADNVAIAHTVFVERGSPGSGRVLEPARALRRGDRVVYVVSWRAAEPERFTITNPLPRSVAYQGSADGREDVSTDGGRTWGKLGDLRVRDGNVWRDATPEDVTHVRWQVPRQLALAGRGQVTWSAIVR
jgi:hypothetical protein